MQEGVHFISPSHMDAHGENSWQHTSQPAVVTSLPFFPGEKYLESSEISAVLFFGCVCMGGGMRKMSLV